MPTPTYIPLATKTLTATATSVTFSSISQAYRDLVLVADNVKTNTTTNISLRFNNDSGNTNWTVAMGGDGASAQSIATPSGYPQFSATSFSSATTTAAVRFVLNVMDYSATDKHKTALNRGFGDGEASAYCYRWENTAAVTSVTVLAQSPNTIAVGATFTLYGIAS